MEEEDNRGWEQENNKVWEEENKTVFHRNTVTCLCNTGKYNCFPLNTHCNLFVFISAKFAICTVVGLNGTLAEAKKLTWAT